jgi:hypothetical protein
VFIVAEDSRLHVASLDALSAPEHGVLFRALCTDGLLLIGQEDQF